MIEFEQNDIIKNSIYLFNYVVYGNNYSLIIVKIYDKYTFSVNNIICKTWTQKKDIF